MPNSLENVQVKVKRRSGFDKSFKNILTTKVGTITPIAYKLLIPNSDFNVKVAISAALPPLASDTFMRAALKVEAFAVPMRLLYGGFTSWLTGEEVYKLVDGETVATRAKLPRVCLPFANIASGASFIAPNVTTEDVDELWSPDIFDESLVGRGSLADYLGFRGQDDESQSTVDPLYFNIFPFLAYHRIYDDWYRNRKVQRALFGRPIEFSPNTFQRSKLGSLPFECSDEIRDFYLFRYVSGDDAVVDVPQFIDGTFLGELHQRNYGSDYFTEAMPEAQFGSEQKVTIDDSSKFTISALRLANALQMFEEKNNISSPALQDYCKVNYGANLSSGIAQRAIYLGSASFDVYSKGVNATADSTPTNNPFGTVGARYGNAFASGSEFVVHGHVDEPCYLMVVATLVPEANYSFGIKRDLTIFTKEGSLMDMPNPAFELIGNEPVYAREVGSFDTTQIDSVFGWLPRYQWHKSSYNEVHGLLLEGESLASFVAQRAIDRNAVIGADFLKIGTDDLDNVTAVTGDLSKYGCMIDSFIKLSVVEPLGESALPSLVDPAAEHGESVYMRRNGSRL